MIYIAVIVLIITGIQLINALMNYFLRINYARYNASQDALVSVIIPARNEEKNIRGLLENLKNQSYQHLEIIVVNDDSTDNTADLVIEESFTDSRISLIHTGLINVKWLGKNHACYEGARQANGQYFLFLDADVSLGPRAIESVLGYLKHSNSAFVSVFPKQLIVNREVATVIPLMNYILLSMLPLIFVRYAPFTSMSAANGQFMFFDAQVYRKFEPHKRFKMDKVEDISIARFLKKQKIKIACLTGKNDISCTMYNTYNEAMEGFTKNIVAFFGNSYPAAISFWILNFAGAGFVLWGLSWHWLIIYLFMLLIIRLSTSIVSMQNGVQNIALHYVQLYNLGKLIYQSWNKKIKKNYQWKGRNISS